MTTVARGSCRGSGCCTRGIACARGGVRGARGGAIDDAKRSHSLLQKR